MNIYVSQFKDVVKNYRNKDMAILKEEEQNLEKYSTDYGNSLNAKLEQQRMQYSLDAKDMINSIFEQVRGYLAVASFPNVEMLTADRLLFADDCGIEMTATEVGAFVERYRENPTMLRLIKTWIDNKHSGMNDFATISHAINLPENELQVYKTFAESALSLIDTLYADSRSVSEALVNAYADEQFSVGLYDVIGDGMSLSNYKNKRLPESVKHS